MAKKKASRKKAKKKSRAVSVSVRHKKAFRELLAAAEEHGMSSEPDMEVGDLQGLLMVAWELMAPVQREALLNSYQATDLLESWGNV